MSVKRWSLLVLGLAGGARLGLSLLASCDHLDQPTVGPPLHVLETSLAGGTRVAAGGVIQIAFDRYLHPATTIPESVVLRDASGGVVAMPAPLRVIYDPVARVVTIAGPDEGKPWLTPGQSYQLVLPVASGKDDLGGFRAIDRAALEQEVVLSFTADAASATGAIAIPKVDFCADVLPLFVDKCTNGTCHASTGPNAASLVLDTSTGVSKTALARVANGANTGPLAGRGAPPGRHFGVDMPIVDPGNAGNSWLLYKIELAPLPNAPGAPPGTRCEKAQTAPAPPFTAPLSPKPVSDDERARLSDFIRGREMPYPVVPADSYVLKPLTFDERERVRLWIAGGAAAPECGACGVAPDAGRPLDGGTKDGGDAGDAGDAGPSDAAADGDAS